MVNALFNLSELMGGHHDGLAASGKAVVVSSHQLGEVEKSVDHLGVLAGGRLVYEGPLADFAAAGQSLEQAFFTAVGVAR